MLKKKTRPSEENIRLSLGILQNLVEITKAQKFEKIVKKVLKASISSKRFWQQKHLM